MRKHVKAIRKAEKKMTTETVGAVVVNGSNEAPAKVREVKSDKEKLRSWAAKAIRVVQVLQREGELPKDTTLLADLRYVLGVIDIMPDTIKTQAFSGPTNAPIEVGDYVAVKPEYIPAYTVHGWSEQDLKSLQVASKQSVKARRGESWYLGCTVVGGNARQLVFPANTLEKM